MERTSKTCSPSAGLSYFWGKTHGSNASPSSEHSKVASLSLEENPKAWFRSLVKLLGLDSIRVSGLVWSTTTVRPAERPDSLRASSVAVAW